MGAGRPACMDAALMGMEETSGHGMEETASVDTIYSSQLLVQLQVKADLELLHTIGAWEKRRDFVSSGGGANMARCGVRHTLISTHIPTCSRASNALTDTHSRVDTMFQEKLGLTLLFTSIANKNTNPSAN